MISTNLIHRGANILLIYNYLANHFMGVFVVSTDWIIYRYTLIFKNGFFLIAVLFDSGILE